MLKASHIIGGKYMSKGEFVLRAVEVMDAGIFNQIREACSEKVEVLKAFRTMPKFIGNDNPEMHLADDGTKCCFMFNGREPAKAFASCLSKQLGVKLDVDSFIGYGTVYVPAEYYEEAIQKGVNNLLINQNGCWVDFYNERKCYDYEPIMALTPHSSCYDKNGRLKRGEEIAIRMWFKNLERVLREELLFDKEFRSVIEIGIRRGQDAHLRHEDILNKIRQTDLLEKSPFEGYAYMDYYGKYIK